jgi:hypothetical protein
MSNLSYDILTWNSIIPEGSVEPHPYITINSDIKLMDLTNINGNKIHIRINDTKSKYDTQFIGVIINKNTILIKSKWYGEPVYTGNVTIEMYNNSKVIVSSDNNFYTLSVGIFMILLLILLVYKLIRHYK